MKAYHSGPLTSVRSLDKDVMYGCESWTIKKLSTEELVLLNCGVGEDS